MRPLLFTSTAILLAGCSACLAQVSTMGSTAMGLPSTPGTIVTSPLNGPSPFSATTQPGTSDTTLAPVPLASDPTTPGTVVTCSIPTGQIAPGTPAVPVTSTSAIGGTTATLPSVSTATISTVPAASSTSTTGNTTAPMLALSAQPATSFLSTIPGTTVPAPPTPAMPALSPPSITATSVPTPSTLPSTVSTSMAGGTATMTPSTAPLGIISTPIVGSTTGTISPVSPLGSSSTTVCSSTPGGPPTNGAALPLSTPAIPASPPPGTIPQDVTQLCATSIDPTTTIMPTPNTSACVQSVTMSLSTPGTMAPANATGAAATPGVSPASPSGC